jgi:hypothetical protein
MTDQDQINERNCCLIIRGGRLTTQTLAFAMGAFLYGSKKIYKNVTTQHGKQTVKQLATQGATLTNIEIRDENIKSFESTARKYAIDFAVKKDISETPAKYLVFFKSKDTDMMTAAFKEFSTRQLDKSKQKPSIIQTLQKMMEKVKNQVFDQTKNRDRGQER